MHSVRRLVQRQRTRSMECTHALEGNMSCRWALTITLAVVLVGGTTGSVRAQATARPTGTVHRITVHGRSLEGNLEGESPDRAVTIYLPPGYDASTARRYPVVYLLHGYGITDQYWTGVGVPGRVSGIDLPGAMDRAIANRTAHEMIVVMPNAYTSLGGSMYSSSVTTGDWESFVADDLVAFVDSHYRTVANRMGRGLAGHSMGGYGTIRIGMKRPDVFSSLYMMSSCCLMNNPLGASRGDAARGRGTPADGRGNQSDGRGRGGLANVQLALAAAWSASIFLRPLRTASVLKICPASSNFVLAWA